MRLAFLVAWTLAWGTLLAESTLYLHVCSNSTRTIVEALDIGATYYEPVDAEFTAAVFVACDVAWVVLVAVWLAGVVFALMGLFDRVLLPTSVVLAILTILFGGWGALVIVKS